MRRPIIEIDEKLCNGCGQCVDACAEGAIKLVNGKARVVRDEYCDGLGACVGECPVGALKVVEREVADFDARATEAHVRLTRGEAGVRRMQEFHGAHGAPTAPAPVASMAHGHGHGGGGCPGSQVRMAAAGPAPAAAVAGSGLPARVLPSDLGQWPVQLHLVPVRAPFFQDRELVVLATCGPVASADVHWRFLRGRSVVVACPKLDHTEPYLEKLAGIFQSNRIPKVLVVRMEVPCCGGLTQTVLGARTRSGRADLPVEEIVIGLDGAVQGSRLHPAGSVR